MGKVVLPVAYQFTEAEIAAGAANNLPKGTSVIVIDANSQPIDVKTAQGGGQSPTEGSGLKNNFAGTTAPLVTNDSSQGYAIGSRWIDIANDESYICLDATTGSAVWSKTTVGVISEIANLQSTLDGKSATTHNHTGTYEPSNTNIQSHVISTANPHSVIKSQVGLGSVDDTADTAKPVSIAQQTALNGKHPMIVVGTIDANSTGLQDNTIYIGNNTGVATNTPGGWAWMLHNFKIGSWRLQIYQSGGSSMYFRSVDGTFTTNIWSKIADATDWTSYTPIVTSESGGWTNYTATGRYRIIDKMLTVSFRIIFSTTSSAASALYVNLPSGLTMNAAVMTGGAGWDTDHVGFGLLGDSGTVSGVPAIITTRTTQKILVKYYNAAAGSYLTTPGLDNTTPWTWTWQDTIDGQFTVPIV